MCELPTCGSNATPDASFEQNAQFYDDATATIRTMRVRANAQPTNDILVKQLDLLQKTFDDFQKFHQLVGPNLRGE